MTVHASIPLPAENALTPFILLRHELIEAFARLEVSICRCLMKYIPACKIGDGSPLGAKIKELEGVKASNHLTKGHAERIQFICQSLPGPMRIRAAVVHGNMRLGALEGKAVAIFQDALSVARDVNCHTILSQDDFKNEIKTLTEFNNNLRAILNAKTPATSQGTSGQPT